MAHFCRRNWAGAAGAEGGYEPILSHLKRLKVGQLVLEYSIPVFADGGQQQRLGLVEIVGDQFDPAFVEELALDLLLRPGPGGNDGTNRITLLSAPPGKIPRIFDAPSRKSRVAWDEPGGAAEERLTGWCR